MSQRSNEERREIDRELFDSCVDEAGGLFVGALAIVAAVLGVLAIIWSLKS